MKSTTTSEPNVIYRPWITVDGKRLYAKNYGKKAFRIEVQAKSDDPDPDRDKDSKPRK